MLTSSQKIASIYHLRAKPLFENGVPSASTPESKRFWLGYTNTLLSSVDPWYRTGLEVSLIEYHDAQRVCKNLHCTCPPSICKDGMHNVKHLRS